MKIDLREIINKAKLKVNPKPNLKRKDTTSFEPKFVTVYDKNGTSYKVARVDVPILLENGRYLTCPICLKSHRNKGVHKDSGRCPSLRPKLHWLPWVHWIAYCDICKANGINRPFYAQPYSNSKQQLEQLVFEHKVSFHQGQFRKQHPEVTFQTESMLRHLIPINGPRVGPGLLKPKLRKELEDIGNYAEIELWDNWDKNTMTTDLT